jgi:hypothetical protein
VEVETVIKILTLLFAVLVVLKLVGVISISWLAVFLPLTGVGLICIGIGVLLVLAAIGDSLK